MTNVRPSRRLWRFALAVVVLFAAVAWLVAWPVYQRHRAIQEIERVGGAVGRDAKGQQRLRKWGLSFMRVSVVNLGNTKTTDNDLHYFGGLKHLRILNLNDTDVGDDGLRHLSGLTSLEVLVLKDTNITDRGLTHLKSLSGLEWLSLYGTRVTDDGVKVLQASLPNCQIEWNSKNDSP